jgi:hypothetical protein
MLRPMMLGLTFAALALGGCDNKQGTSFTFNTSDGNGTVALADNGQTGQVALNVPGFSGKINLPKFHLDGDDVEFNGVHLYPGSKVTGMNIDAGHDDGTVHIAFDSPADPASVRDYFQSKLSGAGFTLHADGDGLAGTTDEHKPFKLELQPDGAGHAKGMITVS